MIGRLIIIASLVVSTLATASPRTLLVTRLVEPGDLYGRDGYVGTVSCLFSNIEVIGANRRATAFYFRSKSECEKARVFLSRFANPDSPAVIYLDVNNSQIQSIHGGVSFSAF